MYQLGVSVGSAGTVGWGREAAGFGRDLGIDLVHGSVAVFEDVVLIVEFGVPLSQRQLMSVALVDPESELPRRELAREHVACECSGDGFLMVESTATRQSISPSSSARASRTLSTRSQVPSAARRR